MKPFYSFFALCAFVCHLPVAAQNKTQSSAPKLVQNDSITKKTEQAPADPQQDYIVRRANGQILDFREKWMIWSDSAQIRQLEKRGLRKEYNRLYDLLVRGAAKQELAILQQYSSLRTEKLRTSSKVVPGDTRWVAWILATNGYTIERVQEVQRQTGINMIEEYYNNPGSTELKVLTSPLIIAAHIDSMSIDQSYADGHDHSIYITATEIIKGNTAIKNIVIRAQSGTIYEYLGKKTFHYEGKGANTLKQGKDYLLILNKYQYEYSIEEAIGDGKKIEDKLRENCYDLSVCIALFPIYEGTDQWYKVEERRRIKDAQRLRELYKKFAPIFSLFNQNK